MTSSTNNTLIAKKTRCSLGNRKNKSSKKLCDRDDEKTRVLKLELKQKLVPKRGSSSKN